ncbi:MAG TPA: HlyD family efflux transporter periplasmic adaptor subunit [Thermoanaerobaculia bacterium]|nr:HlyD family efflux transporter periplasmic adaptor subunit [Thermoanaerobaculia bacterium]
MKRIALITGTLLVAAIALAAVVGGRAADPEVPLYVVERGDFSRRVTAEGNLKAVKATALTPPMGAQGPLKISWIALDGSPVRAGEVVVRFDPTDFEMELVQGSWSRDVATNKVTREQSSSSAVRHNLQRDVEQAEVEYEAAQVFAAKDPGIFSRNEIIESQIDGDLAMEKKEYAFGVLGIRETLSDAERALLAIEMRSAQTKVRNAEQGLEALEVTAPHDGILVLSRDGRGEPPRVGDTIWRGRPIGEIPDLTKMEAEVFVLEADAGGIEPGQNARVFIEARPDISYDAKVIKIDKVARPRMRGVPVQYFGVTLELDRTDPELMKPGSRVRATLIVSDRTGVLTVPRQAVFDRENEKIVYRWDGKRFDPVVVSLDGSSTGRLVVSGGLSAGDRIALRDPQTAGEEENPAMQEAVDGAE